MSDLLYWLVFFLVTYMVVIVGTVITVLTVFALWQFA